MTHRFTEGTGPGGAAPGALCQGNRGDRAQGAGRIRPLRTRGPRGGAPGCAAPAGVPGRGLPLRSRHLGALCPSPAAGSGIGKASPRGPQLVSRGPGPGQNKGGAACSPSPAGLLRPKATSRGPGSEEPRGSGHGPAPTAAGRVPKAPEVPSSPKRASGSPGSSAPSQSPRGDDRIAPSHGRHPCLSACKAAQQGAGRGE